VSRELDAEVAEKVMGWTVEKCQGEPFHYFQKDPYKHMGIAQACAEQLKKMYLPVDDLWSPSTDIKAAWEVVEKIRERFSIHSPACSMSETGYKAFFSWEDETYSAVAATAPEAICRAALKACEK